ncbi:putative SOS response-associated peptidase YedK [Tumebacillus sp. BK434]|uniref:SOS response-associated peptidase n=1 Tax=Tumebacillus sp. BK434 TaxID=2512169 RepID=UPI0010473FDD|nr:SOS response-associated peptidase [Tumebacillus sp. BK434]TCP55804.1 putative SOS response-associated peptidase YedK [Tumebacillus sp. BK434]
MCGRFTLTITPDQLAMRFETDEPAFDYAPRYNIAPGQLITAVIQSDGKNRIGQLKWGLVPPWAQDEKIGYKMINAKSETVAEKPAFKSAFLRKRCLIPADGFYEWQATGDGKQPMRILLKHQDLFAFAGLYETWTSPEGSKVHTCTLLTTKPNSLVASIHDRMPVILRREDEAIWLDRGKQDAELLHSLLVPYPEDEMYAYPVDKMVGNVRNEVPACIAGI